jgi:hypothetical protein
MTFKVGQRLKAANGFVTPEGVIIPANCTVEIMTINGSSLTIHAKWKLGSGDVAEWSGTIDALDKDGKAVLIFGKGRPMFPGEKPPALGDTFGITGQNNDYTKLAKQGRRGTVVTAETAEVAAVPPAAPATTGTVVGGPQLSATQVALLGSACPTPSCIGTMIELTGTRKTAPVGKKFAIVKCSLDCGSRIDRQGNPALGDVRRAKSAPSVSPTPAVASAPVFTPSPLTAAVNSGATVVLNEVEAEPTVKAPKVKKATPIASTGISFPTKNAMKLASDVRTMTVQGTTDMTFSLRKALSWATASIAFSRNGVPEKEAVAAGFRLTVFDREVEESQGKLEQLFQSIFGYKPTVKSLHPAVAKTAIIDMALSAGLNLWLSGPTGCGKTYSVLDRLKKSGRKFIRVQGGGDVTRESLVGYMALENGNSVFKPGPLTVAMELGYVIVIDEIDKFRDEVLSELTAVLEGNSLVLMDDGGRIVTAAAGFAVIATANTVGRGEGHQYTQTKVVNEALRDRFVFLTFNYDDVADLGIVETQVSNLGATSV